jgi:hypothetical protein
VPFFVSLLASHGVSCRSHLRHDARGRVPLLTSFPFVSTVREARITTPTPSRASLAKSLRYDGDTLLTGIRYSGCAVSATEQGRSSQWRRTDSQLRVRGHMQGQCRRLPFVASSVSFIANRSLFPNGSQKRPPGPSPSTGCST